VTTQNAALPSYEDGFNHLYDNVHARVFFGRLANQYGLAPNNEKEAHDLLLLAGQLRAAKETEKQSSDSRFGGPLQALNSLLGGSANYQSEQNMAIKQAAYDLADDPLIYNSVLACKQREAELWAMQQQG
jgi:hypothetical protein